MEELLIRHCIEKMASKDCVRSFLGERMDMDVKKSWTLKDMSEKALNAGVDIKTIREYFREIWSHNTKPDDLMSFHKVNLKSEVLKNHNWHGAMPSFLHRGMQNLVRQCCSEQFGLKDLLDYGSDIMKQEYFIVATHDIIEASIIKHFEDVIPPIGGNKSITDFIFKNIPFDLKVSHYPDKLPEDLVRKKGQMNDDEKKEFALWFIQNADNERTRKQAEGSINNWGLNRMYILVQDEEKWLKKPEAIITKVLKELEKDDIVQTITLQDIVGDISVIVIEV
ncbi:MAG: hypothetical protein K6F40_00125 [Bacteroidales bacterium]|nr:hypothetical protein [Bacteroidales bacterium]